MTDKTKMQKTINLALQGGGAHGAFTWGILDYLLEDGRIDFEGITATSAGAMNAAAFAAGYTQGGPEKARETLDNFWSALAEQGRLYTPANHSAFKNPMAALTQFNPFIPKTEYKPPAYNRFFDTLAFNISPYTFNPMNYNPLRDVIEQTIDFKALHDCDCFKLFINATDVQTGTPKVFETKEITTEVLLASAALPFLFQSVEIEHHYYWDGGYMGNPSLWPLFYKAECRDILIAHVNPIRRNKIPKEAHEIENRINEITFNASLLKELRAISFVQKLIRKDMLKDEYKDQYTDVLLHAIRADDIMDELSIASKYDTNWEFLIYLKDMGRKAAHDWLSLNFEHINKKETVSIEKDYLKST